MVLTHLRMHRLRYWRSRIAEKNRIRFQEFNTGFSKEKKYMPVHHS